MRPGQRNASIASVAPQPLTRSHSIQMADWIYGSIAAIATGALLFALVPHQMYFHDEGQYAQGAERILLGELPHRDFHEMYTGGLAYLNALVFQVAGHRLDMLRYALVLLAIPVSVVSYHLLRGLKLSPWAACVLTVALFSTSLGTMHAPWANSYLMLFTLLAIAALLQDAKSPHLGWVLAAGICCGLAIAVKVTGLYTLAAIGLSLTYRGDPASPQVYPDLDFRPLSGAVWIERLWRGALALLMIALAVVLIRQHLSIHSFMYFVLPIAFAALTLVSSGGRLSWSMFGRYAVLGFGTAFPIALLLTPWLLEGAIQDFWHGVFELPRLRIGTTYYPPPPATGLLIAIPTVCCFLPIRHPWAPGVRITGLLILTSLMLYGLGDKSPSGFHTDGLLTAMSAWRWVLPIISAITCVVLTRSPQAPLSHRVGLYCLTICAACFSLNQYPFAQPIYFFFCVPLVILAAVALSLFDPSLPETTAAPGPRAMVHTGTGAVIVLAAFCLLRFGIDGTYGEFFESVGQRRQVYLSGIAVPAVYASGYNRLRELADEVLSEDQTVLAGPDCPHIYFLTGRRNPTPYMYDIFVTDPEYFSQLIELAHSDQVGMVIISRAPEFSPVWPQELVLKIAEAFSYAEEFERFIVLTKRAPASRP
ncbi:Dolichyl-phosphate-mannose-protein mannosyltransferase [Planctopirus ephydatiae]|uniref:Dolichyl-phosphate-mannose-protein mannosyltransferase n=1 Tax=Planctopirus ephydatiae TaxID=2528019 RepID=A0A518GMC1_9PLAN|nr:phospholipid carrier-dependent glycosyltransferase [Planctopirus ephydatiae]QDV29793.1 Dolichyl-phosphate-mannose-protein mannosyltransferase [Planctopirus ephydatiae]